MNVPKVLKFLLLTKLSLFLCLTPRISVSDTRTDYLIKMLETSTNYRLRVQAATTLGKLRQKEAVPALKRAIFDTNELVVISAAIALKQIGDPSVLPELEGAQKKTKSKAAKSQLALTIGILKQLKNGGNRVKTGKEEPRFFIRVDAMGNSSANQNTTLTRMMRDVVLSRVEIEPDVLVQNKKMNSKAVENKLKNEGLSGYIISGSILKMDLQENRMVVKLGLNLFSNPEYNLLMMPTAEATITVDTVKLGSGDGLDVYQKALKIVADSLIDTIFDTLRKTGTK